LPIEVMKSRIDSGILSIRKVLLIESARTMREYQVSGKNVVYIMQSLDINQSTHDGTETTTETRADLATIIFETKTKSECSIEKPPASPEHGALLLSPLSLAEAADEYVECVVYTPQRRGR
jgi:hypothetical protein